MADLFLDDESSIEASQPKELFEIVVGSTTYYLTSADRDVTVASQVYKATAMGRGELDVPKSGGGDTSLEVTLPVDHPIVQRYFQLGVPPRKVTVTLKRLQVRSGLIETFWIGDVTSVQVSDDNTSAVLRVPSRATETIQRSLPTVTCGRACVHLLYDGMCQILRTGSSPAAVPFKCVTTVLYVNGRDVRVDLSTVPVGDTYRARWSENGELVHVATGERMTIRAQDDLSPGASTVTSLSMQMPIPELQVGDSVEIYAGCAHDMTTCNGKFGNRQRYGGFNRMPSRNIFDPTHIGVGESDAVPQEF